MLGRFLQTSPPSAPSRRRSQAQDKRNVLTLTCFRVRHYKGSTARAKGDEPHYPKTVGGQQSLPRARGRHGGQCQGGLPPASRTAPWGHSKGHVPREGGHSRGTPTPGTQTPVFLLFCSFLHFFLPEILFFRFPLHLPIPKRTSPARFCSLVLEAGASTSLFINVLFRLEGKERK